MGEEISDTMNLDLNLGPGPESGLQTAPNDVVSFTDWINESSERASAVTRIRTRHRSRFRQLNLPILAESQSLSIELNQLLGSSPNGASLQAGEGSIAAEARGNEDTKTCENGNGGGMEDNVSEKKGDVEKSNGNDGSFFDCNICLDLAKEPVVTCCGHLFCWSCLYQWLQISDAKECPVCKGEVTQKAVTPIYGRGNHRRESEENSETKIPTRPHARRVESLRQTLQRSPFTIPMEEMIRRLQSRFDRYSTSIPDFSNRETSGRFHERASSILNRFMTSRGVRGEQNSANVATTAVAADVVAAPLDEIDLTPSIAPDLEGETPRLHPLLIRRQLQSHRVARISPFSSSAFGPVVDAYVSNHPLGRTQEQNAPVVVDDRDSFSSIAAVINSESQVDAVEIDSMALSTSSSRRRNENTSRVSDVDSVDSRPLRRRRLT
ncbi:PREDICTED: uncharacterized protein LOC104820181 [Tarenaya hassleriana]|uniref:uncharacterized protein LOC104820181 n=1 Tax=Tarenaya hassleriana TaxID=28532 RepID=UPI00053C0931|nr:PREDICTED: uncharacterized protein LOC104820181 [Tarenaya hassleriana]